MTTVSETKPFNLAVRTFLFAKRCREFVSLISKTLRTFSDCEQLIRSSGSVGANYIEANESLSKKDFLMRLKICRKEAKESGYWLQLIETDKQELNAVRLELIQEAKELVMIFNSIINKSTE